LYFYLRFIKLSSPNINNLICVGGIVSYASVFLGGVDSSISCSAQIPLFCNVSQITSHPVSKIAKKKNSLKDVRFLLIWYSKYSAMCSQKYTAIQTSFSVILPTGQGVQKNCTVISPQSLSCTILETKRLTGISKFTFSQEPGAVPTILFYGLKTL